MHFNNILPPTHIFRQIKFCWMKNSVSFFHRSVYENCIVFFTNYILSSSHLFKPQCGIYTKLGQRTTNNTVTQAILRANFFLLFMTLPLATSSLDIYFSFLSYHTIFNSKKTRTTQFRLP